MGRASLQVCQMPRKEQPPHQEQGQLHRGHFLQWSFGAWEAAHGEGGMILPGEWLFRYVKFKFKFSEP